jgi:murein DD-endopeptidase MepM/ murein hydrolase activator NlpD
MPKLAMPFNNPSTYEGHSGVDFGQPTNQPILASAEGRVVYSGRVNERAGWGVIVEYDGIDAEFLYCHQPVNATRPKTNARIANGGYLGLVGSTGSRSTGPHLHLEVVEGEGAHTYEGVWVYFDEDKVVGQGSPSGGGNNQQSPVESLTKEEIMNPILLQLDPQVDGRWVLIRYDLGTYWPIRNGWQLDRIREDKTVFERQGPQPLYVVDGLDAVGR